MADKSKKFLRNEKKQKGENKKNRPQTEYQRTRDAFRKTKHRKDGRVSFLDE